MKKVLIALDYNPSAQKIAEVGFELAKAMHAETVLLHVLEEPGYYAANEYSPIMGFSGFLIPGPGMPEGQQGELRQAANEFLEKSRAHLGSDGIAIAVQEGDTASAIGKYAESCGADLIVIGSHSRRGLEKILMGSVTESVLHHSKMPLYIIPVKD